MRSPLSRRWTVSLAIVTAFVAGVGVGQLPTRAAHAQSLSAATVYVPPGGLVFRASDGTALARISRDAHGGTFELFDDRHGVSSTRPPGVAPDVPALAPNPYAIDQDPFASPPPATRDEVF